MTSLLQEAFRVARELPDSDQDAIASRILEDIRDEQQWQQQFSSSLTTLRKLADEALTEHARGKYDSHRRAALNAPTNAQASSGQPLASMHL